MHHAGPELPSLRQKEFRPRPCGQGDDLKEIAVMSYDIKGLGANTAGGAEDGEGTPHEGAIGQSPCQTSRGAG
jgi:hypothetical protein